MNAKQYLLRARKIDEEIDGLLLTIEKTRDRLTKATQGFDGDGAQSSKDPHKFDGLVELEDLCNRRIDELVAVKTETLRVISLIDDSRIREILKYYYVDGLTWERVCVAVHYSWKQTHRLHRRGLQETEKILAAILEDPQRMAWNDTQNM